MMAVSAKTGEGIDEWLKEVLHRTDAGKHITEVDYDIYAEGEAVLGWLNTTIEISGELTDWDAFAKILMKDFNLQFNEMGASVGHVKMMLESGNKYLMANLTGKGNTFEFRGSAGNSNKARLILNARVEMSPDALEQIVRKTLDANLEGNLKAKTIAFRCLSPGRPNPTFRFDHIVSAGLLNDFQDA
jgi:hypothetical protein